MVRKRLACLHITLAIGWLAAFPADAAPPPSGGLRFPGIFSDGMVLQRGQVVPVWGWADPDTTITVEFAGQSKATRSSATGTWLARLDPLAADDAPQSLVVRTASGGERRVANVLVGEVWLCSGQSNMAMTVDGKNGWLYIGGIVDAKRVVAESTNPLIRQFFVDWKTSTTPLDDCTGRWTAAAAETTAHFSAVGYFFARELHRRLTVPVGIVNASWGGSQVVGWTSREALATGADERFVSRMNTIIDAHDNHDAIVTRYVAALTEWEMRNDRDDPEGTAGDAARASTAADAAGWKTVTLPTTVRQLGCGDGGVVWLQREIVVPEAYGGRWRLDLPATHAAVTVFLDGVVLHEGSAANGLLGKPARPGLQASVARAGRHRLTIKLHAQQGDAGLSGGSVAIVPFDPRLPTIPLAGAWRCDVEKAFAPLPASAPPPVPPVKPVLHWQPVPAQFNGMLHPLIPFAIKGVAWYQGESNVGDASYAAHVKLLVTDWRSRWGQGDFPFCSCLLPGYGPPSETPAESRWAACREAQQAVLELPNTAVVNLLDTCEDGDLHPRDKRIAGERLAAVALARAYHDASIPWSGPVFSAVEFRGHEAVLSFQHADGLAASRLPARYRPRVWVEPDVTRPLPRPSSGGELQGFMVCGEDRQWHWADARIEMNRVVVQASAVAKPVAVRYAWADHPIANLVNADGLPAFPFRTDDFPLDAK
jgi:sialate O-acetylesterase